MKEESQAPVISDIVEHKPLEQESQAEKSHDESEKSDRVAPSKEFIVSMHNELPEPSESNSNNENLKSSMPEGDEKKSEEPADEKIGNSVAVDAVLGSASSTKDAEIALAEQERQVNDLIESEKYKLPLNTPRKHKGQGLSVRTIVSILALVLIIFGSLAALDAGLIKTGFRLPFDFIKDNSSETNNTEGTSSNTTKNESKTSTTTQNAQTVDPNAPIKAIGTITEVSATQKKYNNAKAKLIFTFPATWQVSDATTLQGSFALIDVTLKINSSVTVELHRVTGKGGECTPAAVDKAFQSNNTCPTQEFIGLDSNTSNYAIKYKYGLPANPVEKTAASVMYGYCIRDKTDVAPKLNNPEMGFVLSCDPSDLFVDITGVKDDSQSLFSAAELTDFRTMLKTLSYQKTEY